MRFSFIGTFSLDEAKEQSVRKGNTKSGDPYVSINPFIIAEKNNRMRCELFGMKSPVIKTKNQKGENIEINWENRNDPEVVADVASYMKNLVVVGGARHEFVSTYDAVTFILDNITKLNNVRTIVTGRTQKDFYQGKAKDRFTISSIIVIPDDDKRKNGLNATAVVYWDKSCVDAADFSKEKKIYINGFTSEYIKEEKKNCYVASQFVFDCSKIDFNNPEHLNKTRAKLMELGLDYKDGKLVNNMKAKGYVANEFRVSVANGAKELDFSIEDCTEKQKAFIELGINKLEDFIPKGSVYGAWTTEYKIFTPTLLGDYSNGMVYLEEKPDEFEDQIYVPMMDEKLNDLPFANDMNEPEEVPEDEIDDLFK